MSRKLTKILRCDWLPVYVWNSSFGYTVPVQTGVHSHRRHPYSHLCRHTTITRQISSVRFRLRNDYFGNSQGSVVYSMLWECVEGFPLAETCLALVRRARSLRPEEDAIRWGKICTSSWTGICIRRLACTEGGSVFYHHRAINLYQPSSLLRFSLTKFFLPARYPQFIIF